MPPPSLPLDQRPFYAAINVCYTLTPPESHKLKSRTSDIHYRTTFTSPRQSFRILRKWAIPRELEARSSSRVTSICPDVVSELLKAVSCEEYHLLDVTMCSLVLFRRRFGRTHCLHLGLCLVSVPFPSKFQTIILHALLMCPCLQHAPPISSSLT